MTVSPRQGGLRKARLTLQLCVTTLSSLSVYVWTCVLFCFATLLHAHHVPVSCAVGNSRGSGYWVQFLWMEERTGDLFFALFTSILLVQRVGEVKQALLQCFQSRWSFSFFFEITMSPMSHILKHAHSQQSCHPCTHPNEFSLPHVSSATALGVCALHSNSSQL